MTLRRKILLGTVLALVPVAALLRWNPRGRALCDGVARAVPAFAENLRASGQLGSAWNEATFMFAKRQDILGARWIERGKWSIRLTESMDEPGWGALKVWHDGKRIMDSLDEMWFDYLVAFPGHPANDSTADSPGAFVFSYQRPSAGSHVEVWIVSPVKSCYLRECENYRWDDPSPSGDLIFEARQRIPTVVVDWFCWVVYRVEPHAGVQLLAEDNRLPEPSEEWLQNKIARNPAGPYVDLHETLTQWLVSGQWQAAGTLARSLRSNNSGMDWATLIDKTIGEIELENPLFTPMFDAYRAEMGTPWHESDAPARTPAD